METLRVLVVDDEKGMRMAISRALRDFEVILSEVEGNARFEIGQAETGEEGIEKIAEIKPDILLLDYKLPGISGLDVLEHISSNNIEIMTIMMTAYASIETAVTATKQGAYDFLAKPFTPEELKSVVRKASGRLILRRRAKKLAEEKRQVRFQFISVLVHELKAPLAAIEGYLQIMDNHVLGDAIDVYDQVIDRSKIRLDGMRKLIIDILDMTRIESGEKRREFSEVDVVELAKAAIETALPEAEMRGITIHFDDSRPLTMFADRSEIEIILNNLVTNAVKYNRDSGSVNITLSAEDGVYTFKVSDTGIGMTKEDTAKLFNEFVRIKNDKTRNILGSGLGLSTTKKLALLYNGDVGVESEPDVGSTFTVTLREPAEETVRV